MYQANSNTNRGTVNPSPMFGSIWVTLYCLLRDYRVNGAAAIESGVDLKKTGRRGQH